MAEGTRRKGARAAQDNLQRVLTNNTRAQNTLNGAFDQLRATLEQQRAEREARKNYSASIGKSESVKNRNKARSRN